MGLFKIGEVVVLLFPFSDLSHEKFRPALVVGYSDYGNIVVAQITSKLPPNGAGTVLSNGDFINTNPLQRASYIRHNKIFTADTKLVFKSLGTIHPKMQRDIRTKIIMVFEELT